MRIIAGKYGSRRFEIPKSFKLRPTTDFAKENFFNILNNHIDWTNISALDLFAGTGSISFELLSRGCKEVTSVEKETVHCAFIKKIQSQMLRTEQLTVVKADVFRFINSCSYSFDFIFADPPYTLKQLSAIPHTIFSTPILKENGTFVIEHSKIHDFSQYPFFKQQRIYGAVNFSFFQK